MEIGSLGGMLRAWGRGGVGAWNSGAREECCGRGDVEVYRYGVVLQAYERGRVEIWRSAARVAC